jgi:hypothetical protein
MKTSELTGPALGWAVAKAAGYKPRVYSTQSIRAELPTGGVIAPFMPGFRWDQGGPIIERERINLEPFTDINGEQWSADGAWDSPTPLVAAMRCYVASQLGDEVDIPEELQ